MCVCSLVVRSPLDVDGDLNSILSGHIFFLSFHILCIVQFSLPYSKFLIPTLVFWPIVLAHTFFDNINHFLCRFLSLFILFYVLVLPCSTKVYNSVHNQKSQRFSVESSNNMQQSHNLYVFRYIILIISCNSCVQFVMNADDNRPLFLLILIVLCIS